MTGRCVLSPRAQRDLEDIWNYTEQRWGAAQAEAYIREIWHHIEAVAGQPAVGRPRPEIRAGYHSYPAGSQLLFYRRMADGIDMMRIRHRRMDFQRHL